MVPITVRRSIAAATAFAMATVGLTLLSAEPAAAVTTCTGTPSTTWTGAVSSDWGTAGNWTSGVPTSGSSVCVPADQQNDPTITAGTAAAVDSIQVVIGGTLTVNQGSLAINTDSSIATLTVSGTGVALSTNGALTVDTAFNMNRGDITGSGSITSVIGTNFATANPKNIGVNFTNQGTLVWSDGDLNFGSKAVVNTGEWRAQGAADTINAATFTNSGTFNKSATGTETINADVIMNGGSMLVTAGSLAVPQARSFTLNGGTVTPTGSGVTLNRGTGTVQVVGGFLKPQSGGAVVTSSANIVGGYLTGDGIITGNVVASSGFVMPGAETKYNIATLTINGNYTQAGALYAADVSNPTSRDVLAVSGSFTISSGGLRIDGQASGNTFYDIATYASRSGTYGGIADELPSNPEGYFVPTYGASALRITALYMGTISGTAFTDNNGDGVQNGGDGVGLSSVQVYIDRDNNGAFDGSDSQLFTDSNGNYQFNNITPGNYDVRFGSKAGHARSTALPLNVTVPSGGNANASAGYYLSSTVSGNVYSDNDLSATNSAGDTPASGVNVYFDNNNNGSRDGGETQVTTDGSGNYAFSGVAPGTYRVRVTLPAGGRQTTGVPADTVVTSGSDATNINFGIDAFTGSIAGTVYIDSDQDGVRDAGETAGLANETVFLDLNGNNTRDAGERTTLTDTNGNYSFTVVVPRTYGVRLQTVAGYAVSSTPLTNVVLNNNADLTGQNIGVYQAPSIDGLVYSDLDGDGVKDANEGGIGGVTLFLDADGDGTLDAGEPSVLSSATGTYVFAALNAGTYNVRVQLTGTSTITTANNPSSATISSGTGVTGRNFGVNATGTLGGQLYIDTNGNGVKDSGEANAPDGTVVFVDANSNNALDSGETQTMATAGVWSLPNLRANTYDIDVVLPTGYVQSSPELGAQIVGMDTVSTTDNIGLFAVADLTGSVFRDTNENGARDGGEPGLPGIQVYLDQNSSNAFDVSEPTATTAADGSYSFTDLGPGPHLVRAVLPSGATRTTGASTPIALSSGVDAVVPLIGLDVLGSISGQLFVDANGNGLKDGGESTGVSGATVFIDANHNGRLDGGEASAISNGSGVYQLFFVNPGTYDVDVVAPNSMVQTTAELDTVGVTLNQDVVNGNIGLFAFGSISGRVFFDENKDAIDGNEAGILNATVFVDENRNGRLDAGELQAKTALDGSYTISGVGPGVKAIRTQSWGTALQTTVSPADASLQSGSTVTGKTFGFDQEVVGSGDPQTQGTGYWMIGSDGRVYNFGAAQNYGSIDVPSAPAVGLAPTISGKGYWAATANGGVYTYGDARYAGSAARLSLNQPMIAVIATPTGGGYWLLAADGGVFSFGDAQFFGSTGAMKLNAPVVGMTPTPSGNGYWLVASDGGVFSFGDAQFYGSTGNLTLNQPVVGIAATSDGGGYWMVASDGGMFAFGTAPFLGTAAQSQPLNAPIVGIRARGDGQGYWEVGSDGGVFTYGKAPFFGVPGPTLSAPIVK